MIVNCQCFCKKSHQLLHPYFHAPPPSHLLTGLSLLLTLTESHKFGILFVEEQIDRIDRAVTVLSDNQFGNIFYSPFPDYSNLHDIKRLRYPHPAPKNQTHAGQTASDV